MREYSVGSLTVYDKLFKSWKEHLMIFFPESESENAVTKWNILAKPKLEQLDTLLYECFKLKWSGATVSGPVFTDV